MLCFVMFSLLGFIRLSVVTVTTCVQPVLQPNVLKMSFVTTVTT